MICKNCNKEIEWYRGRPKEYCDKKCNSEHNKKYQKDWYREKHPLKTNNCLTCNKLVISKKYCSKLCYPNSRINGSIWYKINKFKKLKKELEDIGYNTSNHS